MSSNSTLSGKLAGGVVVGVGCVGLAGYVPVLLTIALTKTMISAPFYVFITSLGVTDCMALLAWIVLGLDMLFEGTLFDPWAENIALKTSYFCWYSLILHLLLLAFNRYCSVVRLNWNARLFERRIQPRHWVASIVVLTITAFLPVFIGSKQFIGYAYSYEMIWSISAAITITILDLGLTSLICVLSITLYSLIWWEVRKSGRKVASHSSNGTESKAARERQLKNVKLGVQALFISLFFYAQNFIAYVMALGGFDTGEWGTFFLFTVFLVLNFAVNPFVYLIFNSSLRARMKELFRQIFI